MPRNLILSLLLIVTIPAFARTVRVGIDGMTHQHVMQVFSIMGKQDEVEIVGFAEPNRELAMRLFRQFNVPDSLWFPNLEALIKKTNPEAVCAFNSIFEHLSTVRICAPRGIHVVVEKPLAVNTAHLSEMKSLVDRYHIHLLTNYETTWYSSHARAWQMLKEEKTLGTLRKVVIMDGHQGPIEIGCYKEFTDWLKDPVLNGGGALIDFGCYGADIMTWLMEGREPETVTAVSRQYKPDLYPKVDDETTIILTYPGCQAIIQASWNWPVGRKDTEIYGTGGVLIANRENRMKFTHSDPQQQEEWLSLSPLPHERSNIFSYLHAVLNGKLDPAKDLSSFAVNQVVVKILSAARESARTGKTIRMSR